MNKVRIKTNNFTISIDRDRLAGNPIKCDKCGKEIYRLSLYDKIIFISSFNDEYVDHNIVCKNNKQKIKYTKKI